MGRPVGNSGRAACIPTAVLLVVGRASESEGSANPRHWRQRVEVQPLEETGGLNVESSAAASVLRNTQMSPCRHNHGSRSARISHAIRALGETAAVGEDRHCALGTGRGLDLRPS